MKVKIEDFLLTMGEYCKEHDVEECLQGKCGLSVAVERLLPFSLP